MLNKEDRIEGQGGSKLIQLIKQFGYNQDVNIELATVTSSAPNLKIKVDNMDVELEKDDLIVAEYLTAHSRTVKLTSSSVSDSMTSAGYESHTHNITSLTIEGKLDFNDVLKTGDRVIVAEINDGQSFIVLDRAVTY